MAKEEVMFLILLGLISSFNTERITFNDQSEWIPTIAVDEFCRVHIAHTYPDQIRYITNASGSWVIDSILVSGSTPSIAVTPGGTPHIAYTADDGNDDEVYYATFSGGSWHIDTITNNSVSSKAASIALAPDSTPHVVYYDFTGGLKIWHAVKSLGARTTEFIPGSDIGTYSSIAVDSAGKAHVAFVTGAYGGNREIIYANDTSGTWVTESVTNDALDDDFPSVAVDSDRTVHIAFSKDDGSDWELWYATNSSGSFIATQLTNNVGIHDYGYPSVAVDKNCWAHIAYQENYVAGNFFYLSNSSGSWEKDTIFTGAWNKTYSWVDRNISIDNLGYAHICFANQVSSASTSTEIYHAVSEEAVGIRTSDYSSVTQNPILCQISPNPFKDRTEIKWQISEGVTSRQKSVVSIKIYDVSGRIVKSFNLASGILPPTSAVSWDGKDNHGHSLPDGLYLVRLETPNVSVTKKTIKLK